WYTDNAPKSDAQVAAHFSEKRPVLGICLKRYSMNENGNSSKRSTYIDIPLEIGLPAFISDEHMEEDFDNFKLSLQSVVCHRGHSLHAGHYVSLVRGDAPNAHMNNTAPHRNPETESSDSEDVPSKWMLFDDMARNRVRHVDIKQALKDESPYLLFYQVQPIIEEASPDQPPTYEEASRRPSDFTAQSTDAHRQPSSVTESSVVASAPPSEVAYSEVATETDAEDSQFEPASNSDLSNAATTDVRGRPSMQSNRRSSVAFDDAVLVGPVRHASAPTTPAEEGKTGFFSVSRRGSKSTNTTNKKSRPNSQAGEGRLSMTMSTISSISRLSSRLSKDKLSPPDKMSEKKLEPPVDVTVTELSMPMPETAKITPEQSPEQKPEGGKDRKSIDIGRRLSTSKRKHHKDHTRTTSMGAILGRAGEKEKGGKKHGEPPDRECVVM
ncbi:hypothetical protein LTS18_008618, partial [Coniosporium uncinatum]